MTKAENSQAKQLRLMDASRRYMAGEITQDEFNQIERENRTDYVGAIERLSKRRTAPWEPEPIQLSERDAVALIGAIREPKGKPNARVIAMLRKWGGKK